MVKTLSVKIAALVIITLTFALFPKVARSEQTSPDGNKTIFLPLISTSDSNQVVLGVYTLGYLGQSQTIANEVQSIDAWSGKRLSLVGTYIAIEDRYEDYNIRVPLGLIWDNGYTPFVNLNTSHSLAYINRGDLDQETREMAQAFKHWREDGLDKGQRRTAFLAPLQEMNGDWVPYYGNPSDFKRAFNRIQTIFAEEGASDAVWWVFAPNGWSEPEALFEYYYPGGDKVVAIALSAYNSGYCPTAAWKSWDTAQKVYGPYLERMVQMAPDKPIIVAQTATTAYTSNNYDLNAKSQWIRESYSYLASWSNVFGIIYFNRDQECDWAFYQYGSDGRKVDGYKEVVASPDFVYIAPSEMMEASLLP